MQIVEQRIHIEVSFVKKTDKENHKKYRAG